MKAQLILLLAGPGGPGWHPQCINTPSRPAFSSTIQKEWERPGGVV